MERHLLADAGIAGQDVGILCHGQLGGRGCADLQHTAPLSEVGPVLLVLGTTLRQPIQTLEVNTANRKTAGVISP